MSKINWSQSAIDDICIKYKSGQSSKTLSKEYGCGYRAIIKLLKNNDVCIRSGRFEKSVSDDEESMIQALYKQGLSQKSIGDKLGYSQTVIGKYLAKSGCKIRTIKDYDTRRYSWNENYFDSINTPNKAYWIGWIISDGYVNEKQNSIILKLNEKDKEILESLNAEVSSDRPVLHRKISNGGSRDQVVLTLNSPHAINIMRSYGLVSPKTFTVKFPDYIPEKFVCHFIRGVWDGDGTCRTISRSIGNRLSSVNVVGTQDLLLGIKNRFDMLGLFSNIKDENYKNNIRRLIMNRRDQIIILRNYLYPDGDYLYLQRKHDKFFELT